MITTAQPLVGQCTGGKGPPAGEQGAFLFQTQAVDDICVFHGSLLTIKKGGGRVARRPLWVYAFTFFCLRGL